MKKTTLRMLLAVMGVAVIVYGLISGRFLRFTDFWLMPHTSYSLLYL